MQVNDLGKSTPQTLPIMGERGNFNNNLLLINMELEMSMLRAFHQLEEIKLAEQCHLKLEEEISSDSECSTIFEKY